jgi:signal transduction histidine kinase
VRDNGNGLSQERLDRVFDPERTGDPAICTAAVLARRLGGFARVESAEGIGTAVHLFFRRSPDPAPAEPAAEEDQVRAAE